ncbi:MAG: hypothetical protein ACI843_000967 [Psychrobacter glaciei]|jgi:hypothetical protein
MTTSERPSKDGGSLLIRHSLQPPFKKLKVYNCFECIKTIAHLMTKYDALVPYIT